MGNQIVCPSGQNWYLSDFLKMGYTIERSLFDGTFLLSFLVNEKRPFRNLVVKCYKIPDDDPDNPNLRKDPLNIIQSSTDFMAHLEKLQDNLHGNIVSHGIANNSTAYLVRPYVTNNLQARMDDFPSLTDIEKDWISYQLMEAVKNLHDNYLSHGDIKPENILLTDRLQVLLADHAPFKPSFLKPNQPNFFMHFFSYSGGCAYIAPERIVDQCPSNAVNIVLSDLFSVGCVLAFLYLGGTHIFDFSSLQAYKVGDKSVFEKLSKIQNEKVRKLITQLLSIDPLQREECLITFKNAFPYWFQDFYKDFYSESLHSCYMSDIIRCHSSIVSHFPENIGKDSLLYFNIVADVLLSSGRTSCLTDFIAVYVDMTKKYFDTSMKLTRALPPLLELLEASTIQAILAFNGICEILDSIDEIPEEFAFYHRAVILRRLSNVSGSDFAYHFLCNIPKFSLSMKRLFPNFCTDIKSESMIFQHLFEAQKTDQSKIGIIRAYLRECSRVGNSGDFSLLQTICLYTLPILRVETLVSDVVNVILSFYKHITPAQRKQFAAELLDPLYAAILSTDYSTSSSAENIYALINLISAGVKPKPYFIPQIASCAFTCLERGGATQRVASMQLIDLLPKNYKLVLLAKNANEIITENDSSTPPSSVDFSTLPKSRKRPHTLIAKSPQKKSKPSIKCSYFFGERIGDGPVQSIFHHDSKRFVVHHSRNIIEEITIKPTEQEKFVTTTRLPMPNEIYSFEKVNDTSFYISDIDGVKVYSNGHITGNVSVDTPIVKMKKFGDNSIVTMTSQDSIEVRDIKNLDIKSQIEFGGKAKGFDVFQGTPFIVAYDEFGFVYLIDTRVSLPVFRTEQLSVNYVKAIQDSRTLNFVVGGSECLQCIDPSICTATVSIEGKCDYAIPINNMLYVLNDSGTYAVQVNKPEFSYAFFDQNKIEKLDVRVTAHLTKISFKQDYKTSLHGHACKVTAADYNDPYFISGDKNGVVNVWSPSVSTFQ